MSTERCIRGLQLMHAANAVAATVLLADSPDDTVAATAVSAVRDAQAAAADLALTERDWCDADPASRVSPAAAALTKQLCTATTERAYLVALRRFMRRGSAAEPLSLPLSLLHHGGSGSGTHSSSSRKQQAGKDARELQAVRDVERDVFRISALHVDNAVSAAAPASAADTEAEAAEAAAEAAAAGGLLSTHSQVLHGARVGYAAVVDKLAGELQRAVTALQLAASSSGSSGSSGSGEEQTDQEQHSPWHTLAAALLRVGNRTVSGGDGYEACLRLLSPVPSASEDGGHGGGHGGGRLAAAPVLLVADSHAAPPISFSVDFGPFQPASQDSSPPAHDEEVHNEDEEEADDSCLVDDAGVAQLRKICSDAGVPLPEGCSTATVRSWLQWRVGVRVTVEASTVYRLLLQPAAEGVEGRKGEEGHDESKSDSDSAPEQQEGDDVRTGSDSNSDSGSGGGSGDEHSRGVVGADGMVQIGRMTATYTRHVAIAAAAVQAHGSSGQGEEQGADSLRLLECGSGGHVTLHMHAV